MRPPIRAAVAVLTFFAASRSTLAAQRPLRMSTPTVSPVQVAVLPPSNVVVTGAYQSATLTWSPGAGAVGYRVLRSMDRRRRVPTSPPRSRRPPISMAPWSPV